MKIAALLISLSVISYCLGAIPFAILISRLKNVDLKKVGSGNIGATNVYRAMGIQYAALVFGLDLIKGTLPTLAAKFFFASPMLHVVVGSLAILGHSFTPFAKFKGGKGAATGLGVLLALNPGVFLVMTGLAALIIKTTRYVSVATMSCSVLTPFLLFIVKDPIEYVLFVLPISVFIILRHRSNIIRLLEGKENKI